MYIRKGFVIAAIAISVFLAVAGEAYLLTHQNADQRLCDFISGIVMTLFAVAGVLVVSYAITNE